MNARPTTGLDQTKPKETATRRGGFILQKLALILAFASILAALALSACETTEPSASPREPLATSSPQQTIEEPPRPAPRSTIEEPLTTVRPGPVLALRPAPPPPPEPLGPDEGLPAPVEALPPSTTSSPDYTDWDVERGVEDQEALPEFPWPPPRASASTTISRELLLGSQEHAKLGDAVAALDLAFRNAGYGERSYYSVPKGFAMASRIEQINQDGTAKGPADRWSLEVPQMRKFSFSAYLTALFRARPGYYRVIVFVVTSKPFSQSNAKVTSKEAELWISSGLNALPEDIARGEYTSAHRCTALIYEFKRLETQPAKFVDPSELTGQIHLEKSGLLAAFAKRR